MKANFKIIVLWKLLFQLFRNRKAKTIRRLRTLTDQNLKDICQSSIDQFEFISGDVLREMKRRIKVAR